MNKVQFLETAENCIYEESGKECCIAAFCAKRPENSAAFNTLQRSVAAAMHAGQVITVREYNVPASSFDRLGKLMVAYDSH